MATLLNYTADFIINSTENISDQYEKLPEVKQVPVILAMQGPASIRNRSIAYCVSKGGDPSTITQPVS